MISLKTQSAHEYSITTIHLKDTWCKEFFASKMYKRVFVILDANVNELHGSRIFSQIKTWGFAVIGQSIVPSGEQSKSIDGWSNLLDDILGSSLRRNDAIFIFGGGVTGDLGGFAASTALRGVSIIHFPTTLLSMVDSAIGGKTGINHSSGKNRIGTFYQPEAVICDPDFLKTLPEIEWFCGIGEIIKYACIENPEISNRLEFILQSPNWQAHKDWNSIIQDSAAIKAAIVQKDEKESGIRAYLNFGHTFAHALERVLGYGKISHGDAVFWGCIAACELSNQIGYDIPKGLVEQFLPFYIYRFNFKLEIDELISAMYADKKNKSEKLTFIILEKPGKASTINLSQTEPVKMAWDYMFSKTV